MNKFRNVRTEVDGIKFASAKEARRYGELKLLERAGKIIFLERQKRFELAVNGVHVGRYDADFVYVELNPVKRIVEDVKPTFKSEKARKAYKKTSAYRMFEIKKRLMLACNNIEVIEV